MKYKLSRPIIMGTLITTVTAISTSAIASKLNEKYYPAAIGLAATGVLGVTVNGIDKSLSRRVEDLLSKRDSQLIAEFLSGELNTLVEPPVSTLHWSKVLGLRTNKTYPKVATYFWFGPFQLDMRLQEIKIRLQRIEQLLDKCTEKGIDIKIFASQDQELQQAKTCYLPQFIEYTQNDVLSALRTMRRSESHIPKILDSLPIKHDYADFLQELVDEYQFVHSRLIDIKSRL